MKEFTACIEHTTDTLWAGELRRLRSGIAAKQRFKGVVHTCGDVVLPDFVRRTLSLGPKYAVDKKYTAPDLLAIVRRVSSLAPQEDCNRCVSEGVDVLQQVKPYASSLPLSRTISHLRDNELCVVPSDKEGGFAVLNKDLYLKKAVSAVTSVFQKCSGIDLVKVKSKAKKTVHAA
ncbi:hypothetical protein HPB51_007983 [Rhipicephalus microplus]|uniref:Tick transposon n=1 Tax=Rhipicephalus microplus TaxID=6941 RepID=A0A9J6DLF9_RHIMP|nr:hypothetical protein HPB51_007983 [Rhipicephalus microplus]